MCLTFHKLSYLCSAPETYKITQQMRGLLSVLAGISGSKQFCEITRSFWWTGGDLLGWAELDWVEVTQMELMYILFLDLWIY